MQFEHVTEYDFSSLYMPNKVFIVTQSFHTSTVVSDNVFDQIKNFQCRKKNLTLYNNCPVESYFILSLAVAFRIKVGSQSCTVHTFIKRNFLKS